MKKCIRRHVFETNSSSTHSVCISKGDIGNSYLFVDDEDNKVHVSFGEFGWGYDTLTSQTEKLSYLCTMLMETECKKFENVDDIYQTIGFNQINDCIKEKCNCDGVVFDDEIEVRSYEYQGKTYTYLDKDGYIDHQSCEGYANINDFLNDYGTNIESFIFNNNISVIIDNDNH